MGWLTVFFICIGIGAMLGLLIAAIWGIPHVIKCGVQGAIQGWREGGEELKRRQAAQESRSRQ